MKDDIWWWCVYDESGDQIASSNSPSAERRRSGKSARTAAEQSARIYLGLPTSWLFTWPSASRQGCAAQPGQSARNVTFTCWHWPPCRRGPFGEAADGLLAWPLPQMS